MRTSSAALVLVAAIGAHSAANGQIAFGPHTIELRSVASGLIAPVQFRPVPGDPTRMLIVEQTGQIRVMQNGSVLPTPLLDLSTTIAPLAAGYDERGLLGVAPHPQFMSNGRFFVRYSAARAGVSGEPCFGTTRGCHAEVLAEYVVTPPTSNTASPTGTVLFSIDKPQFNHNGGGIAFGPDGFLYFTLGDGGGANDGLADVPPSHGPIGNAQNLATPLGKVIRFDVSTPGVAVAPPSNPFVGTSGAHPGIFAYGFRNPYDFSFDDFGPGATGSLIVGDVGQNLFEEIDVVTMGNNYGWPIREGAHCFNPLAPNSPPASCTTTGLIDPVLEYPHAFGTSPVGLAVVGGPVYRGSAFPGLHGQYFCADFATAFGLPDGHLFYADMSSGPATPGPLLRPRIGSTNRNLGKYVKGMGRDHAGEMYVLVTSALGPTGLTGEILKIVPCASDYNGSATVTVGDIFDFLNGWFAGSTQADFNGNGLTVSDIFDYLNAWFSGC